MNSIGKLSALHKFQTARKEISPVSNNQEYNWSSYKHFRLFKNSISCFRSAVLFTTNYFINCFKLGCSTRHFRWIKFIFQLFHVWIILFSRQDWCCLIQNWWCLTEWNSLFSPYFSLRAVPTLLLTACLLLYTLDSVFKHKEFIP